MDPHKHRGKVFNWAKVARPISFEGLRWRAITPTDIDLYAVFLHSPRSRGSIYVFGEFKEEGVTMPTGQAWAHEELVRGITSPGRALGFLAWHPPEVNVIEARSALVQRTYCRYRDGTTARDWCQVNGTMTVKELVDAWLIDCGWHESEAHEPVA